MKNENFDFDYNIVQFVILKTLDEPKTNLLVKDIPQELRVFLPKDNDEAQRKINSELWVMVDEKNPRVQVNEEGEFERTASGDEYVKFMEQRLTDLQKKNEEFEKKLKEAQGDLQSLRLRQLLNKERPVFKSLGMGLHNGVFYYGTKIYDEENIPRDAIITSDKRIFVNWGSENQIKNEFGLNYRWPFFDNVLDMHWSNEGIARWLYGNASITVKEAFEKILAINRYFMDYPDERWHKFIALDILSTYFTELFEHKGRTLLCAEHGSGKTRQSEIYKRLAFNSSMSVDWTESAIFRSVESTKATIIIDNFDEVPVEVKNPIMAVFRSYRKIKTVRTEGERKRQPSGFDLFTSMVLNNILGLDEVSEDRARKPKLLKSKNKEIVNRKFTEISDSEWQRIRDDCYICGLQNWKIVLDTYRQLKEEKLIGRELEVYEDILTLAKIIGDDLYTEILKLILDELEQKKVRELSRDYLYLALESILETLKNKNVEESWLKLEDITDEVARGLWDPESKDFDKKKRGVAIYLGKVFKNCPLFKGRIVHGYTEYLFRFEDVLKFCDIKEFDDLKKTYSTYSTKPTLSTNSTNSTSPNNSENQVEKVDKVDKKRRVDTTVEDKPKSCYRCGSTLDLTQTEDFITHKPLWICKKCLQEMVE
jgi:RNase P subunit RPR2